MGWSEGLPVLTALCLVLVSNIAGASSGAVTPSFTCDQIRELFEGDIGSPTALLSNPVYETESSICRKGRPAGEYSCCSADTENGFADLVEKRLKENVRVKNHGLKKHINNILSRYQDRIKQLSAEAENRTSVFLSRLHKIPWAEHQPVVANLYKGIQALVASGRVDSSIGDGVVGGGVEDVVRDFFVNLFPAVYSYAMTAHEESGEQRRPISADYHACLKTYADQIQPFGNQPDRLLRQLRRSLRHAVVFEEAMKTLVDAMTSTAAATMDSSCRHALIRLQVCPGCRGVSTKRSVVKPCRGMCLNVMRGCLAKMSEISSSWDDLVVAFENLQIGMLGRHDLQKLLIYMDMNVSDAIMMATADSPRIYDEVRVKCQHVPRYDPNVNTSSSSSALLPLLPDSAAASEAIAARSTSVLQTFRQEMKTLAKYLDDSKGQFNRLPDSLCQDEQVFAQDMLSDSCWNGTRVGRYMEQVPEANFLSQVQRNKEVKVSLVDPDLRFLQVKESLTHMRRNLSGLLNHEIMLGDSPRGGMMPYRSVTSEGSGGLRHQDVIVDDEDLVAYGSGSGSGSGDGGDGDGDGLSRSTDTPVTRRPSRPPPQSGSNPITVSALLLSVCLGLQSLVHARH